ncbi:unnamed protein product [Polarella glacialis]|uniref:Uncharacterized protein n=2 Tax=Polarella glacialis TaxID=89957 RepID=A0A813H3G0_POLGL|nr:unnamed protein product [Polarella glacialis]
MFRLGCSTYRFVDRYRLRLLAYIKKRQRQRKFALEKTISKLISDHKGTTDLEAFENEDDEDDPPESDEDEEVDEEGDEEDDDGTGVDANVWGGINKKGSKDSDESSSEVSSPRRGSGSKGVDLDANDWNDMLDDADIEELERIVKMMQPNFVPAAELVPEAAMVAELQKKRNPKLKFNALLAFGEGARASRGMGPQGAGGVASDKTSFPKPKLPPSLVVITGHSDWSKGNMGINGVYERYPEDHHGRPAYQKIFERRHVPYSMFDEDGDYDPSREGHVLKRVWKSRTSTGMLLNRRYQVAGVLETPEQGPVFPNLMPAKEDFFLFFDDSWAAWCIGPGIGATEIFAKNHALEEFVPNVMINWECWDVGKKSWYHHEALKVIRAGAMYD